MKRCWEESDTTAKYFASAIRILYEVVIYRDEGRLRGKQNGRSRVYNQLCYIGDACSMFNEKSQVDILVQSICLECKCCCEFIKR